MAVRFILGRAGTGKTRHCLESIQSLVHDAPIGPPIFWLLPRQATFQAERELTVRLGAFTRVRVVGFDELGKQILDACGDVDIPQLTSLGRRLIIAHLLRKHEASLRFYQASARRPGLAAELDATFGEFERAGLDADRLDTALDTADLPPSLRDKLADVKLLLKAYGTYANDDRLDPTQRMDQLLDRVARCPLLSDATVFVDDFFEFGAYEQKLLVAVAAVARRTEITLLIDPDSPVRVDPNLLPAELSLFHRTERTFRSLHFAFARAPTPVPIEPPLLLRHPRRFATPALATMERDLFAAGVSPVAAGSAVQWVEAPDPRTEVDAVARRIREVARDEVRWRDLAVLVRDIDKYQALIDASFAEHGIAFFVDRRRSAVHHPLLQFVRSCLQIARHDWPHDAVMTFLKTGLSGVTPTEADALENYVLLHRIRGAGWHSAEPWSYQRRLTRQEQNAAKPLIPTVPALPAPDAVRRKLADALVPLLRVMRGKDARPMSEFLNVLEATLEAFAVRQTLLAWMSQAERDLDLQQRDEHEQVWTNLNDLLSQMHKLLGQEPITPDDFQSAIDSALERFDLATPPPALDAVLVGPIDRTRTPDLKGVFVLGLNEGSFPVRTSEDCVLSDSDRRMLQKQSIELDVESARQLLDEHLLAYRAFTASWGWLVLTRPLADGKGRPTNPSIFWQAAASLFSDVAIVHEPRPSACKPETLTTPRQLVTALMRWARSPAAACPTDAGESHWPALYQWLVGHRPLDDAVGTMRSRAWPALAYDNRAILSGDIAARMFASPLDASVRQIEMFAACPFRHFARHGLRLEFRESADVTGLDLSQAYHHVLQYLVGEIIARSQDWCDLDPEHLHRRIGQLTSQIGASLRGELMLSTARNRYLLERIEMTLRAAVAGQCEMHRRGRHRPAFAGVRFGPEQKLPAYLVHTPSGRDVALSGTIDRVDLNESKNAVTVIDYRFAAGALPLDRVYYGLNLQLLIYLRVVQESGEKLTGRPVEPMAGFMVGLLRSPQAVDHPDELPGPEHPDFHLRTKPRGLIRDRAVAHFDSQLVQGASPVVQVQLKNDGQVGWRNRSDAAGDEEFDGLLQWVDQRVGELADRLMSGEIEVKPFWLNKQTPCAQCEYRSICRFEPGINGYRHLTAMPREQVLSIVGVRERGGDGE